MGWGRVAGLDGKCPRAFGVPVRVGRLSEVVSDRREEGKRSALDDAK